MQDCLRGPWRMRESGQFNLRQWQCELNHKLKFRQFGIVAQAGIVLLWLAAIFSVAVFVTFSSADPGWNNSNATDTVSNIGGIAGAYVADTGLYLFGYSVILVPICIAQFAWQLVSNWSRSAFGQVVSPIMFFMMMIVTLVSLCGFENLYGFYQTSFHHGGIVGYEITRLLRGHVGMEWVVAIFLICTLAGTQVLKIFPWTRILMLTGTAVNGCFAYLFSFLLKRSQSSMLVSARQFISEKTPSIDLARKRMARQADSGRTAASKSRNRSGAKPSKSRPVKKDPIIAPLQVNEPESRSESESESDASQLTPDFETSIAQESEPVRATLPAAGKKTSSAAKPASAKTSKSSASKFPDTSIMDSSNVLQHAYTEEEIDMMAHKIESTLGDFNVSVKVKRAHPGPVITQFEIDPAAGIKASQIVGLAADLARTLTVQSVRVVDNIEGSPYVGIEVPNKRREIVRLVDGLESKKYRESDHPLTIVLGKDIRGETVVSNLAKMPHLLIAGTTGAGKSVCLNAILLSFLFKSTPENLRLIMIDPKMLEFSIYEGIPHLLVPVITDMAKTERALRWCISEMERRFLLMSKLGVRNLPNYNEFLQNSKEPVMDPTTYDPQAAQPLEPLPYIVFVIDELADLIMVMGKKAEELIIRIAQRARAAGIHLIVATQRPSTDIIRGVLKANIPTRIGFRVASNADSRTILDQTGAENLLGSGDMLFIPPGEATMVRVHGAFVSDDEVKRVVDSIRVTEEPVYDPAVQRALEESTDQASADGVYETEGGEADELYNHAVDFVIRSRRASISSIQRQLRIGYNRAARMIESMEEAGVVSAVMGAGKREVLVPPPQDD